jgi:UDP-N-acetylmuramoyl-L-alanyl-D-glutamate--2,6-diaminopimelate ligase
MNALAALGLAIAGGMDAGTAVNGLAALEGAPGRLQHVAETAAGAQIFVDYAHTPDALEQALAALREHCPGRLICLFGCGGERDTGKRALMGAVAERQADAVFVTDDNPRGEDGDAIVRQILAGMANPDAVRVVREREQAVAAAIEDGDADDLVLLAGKGHETSQEVGGVRHAYSERDAALAALGEVRA